MTERLKMSKRQARFDRRAVSKREFSGRCIRHESGDTHYGYLHVGKGRRVRSHGGDDTILKTGLYQLYGRAQRRGPASVIQAPSPAVIEQRKIRAHQRRAARNAKRLAVHG